MNDTITSVRDRHRHEITVLLHVTAKRLALEQGLDKMRVEDVARIAGVSRRTFFNYFPTKEDAVMGVTVPTLSAEARKAFSESRSDVLTRSVHLFLETVKSMAVTEATATERRALRERFPALHARFHWHMTAVDELLRPVIMAATDEDEQTAEVVVRLASAILRDAYQTNLEVTHESVDASITKFKTVLTKVL